LTSQGRAQEVEALESLIDETRLLFHRMKLAAEQLHAAEEITAGMRGVLFDLDRSGPQTVPQMARARPVSRQHIQMLVNPLVERGFVKLLDNPAHKRSRLVGLTPAGRRLVGRMQKRESILFGGLASTMTEKRYRSAAATLRSVREALAGVERTQRVDARR